MGFVENVQKAMSTLSDTDQHTAQYICSHMKEVGDLSINELASRVHSSRSSISRLAQKLGYHGYTEMKYALQQEASTPKRPAFDQLGALEDEVARCFSAARQYNFERVLEKMKNARNIAIFPAGTMQMLFSRQFSSYILNAGRSSQVVDSVPDMMTCAKSLDQRDLVIFISLSGTGSHLQEVVQLLKLNQVPIVVICQMGNGALAMQADYALYCPGPAMKTGRKISIESVQMMTIILARKYLEYVWSRQEPVQK